MSQFGNANFGEQKEGELEKFEETVHTPKKECRIPKRCFCLCGSWVDSRYKTQQFRCNPCHRKYLATLQETEYTITYIPSPIERNRD